MIMATCHLTPLRHSFKKPAPFPKLLHRTLPSSPCSSLSSMACSPTKKVLIPIANGTEPVEAIITIDVIRRAGADVTVASVESDINVKACWGINMVADSLVSDCSGSSFDLIALPGGMPGSASLRDCKVLEEMVKKQAENGGIYAAICAAPAVALGSWGLLQGLKSQIRPPQMKKTE